MRHVTMLDLATEHKLFEDGVRAVIDTVLSNQQFINGPYVGELEDALRRHTGAGDAVAVSNGTDALLSSLMALDIGHGDEVILPSFTFFGTAGAVHRVGAKPVFVDIDGRTFNMDPVRIEAAVTDRTRAIIAVHLFGQCAEMDAIGEIAARHGLYLIEDAAQALGATYRGRNACTLSDLACVSFYPTKNLGGYGEGGMVFAKDKTLGAVIRQLRNHGESSRYVHERVGGNFRLDSLKAGIILAKLPSWETFTSRRRTNAAAYDAQLGDAPVVTPHARPYNRHVYHQYSILCHRRDELRAFLTDRGVQSGVYYAVPLHLQRCFSHLGYKVGDLPVTEEVCDKIMSLPCHPMLTEDDVAYVASCVHEFLATNGLKRPTIAASGGVA